MFLRRGVHTENTCSQGNLEDQERLVDLNDRLPQLFDGVRNTAWEQVSIGE